MNTSHIILHIEETVPHPIEVDVFGRIHKPGTIAGAVCTNNQGSEIQSRLFHSRCLISAPGKYVQDE